jgi:hypothetical protein
MARKRLTTKGLAVQGVDMKSKAAKFFVAHRIEGKNKSQASKVAGITDPRNINKIEVTKTYQTLERKYAEVLLEKIPIEEVAEAHADNIRQKGDRGARNVAIKMLLDKVEPEALQRDADEQVVVILRQSL